jgi:hypothetical protein
MGERRYTDQEEALEIKSLRRIIAAYAKYALPPTPLLLFSPLPERILPVSRPHTHYRCRRSLDALARL